MFIGLLNGIIISYDFNSGIGKYPVVLKLSKRSHKSCIHLEIHELGHGQIY
jgi:hypothetical protein